MYTYIFLYSSTKQKPKSEIFKTKHSTSKKTKKTKTKTKKQIKKQKYNLYEWAKIDIPSPYTPPDGFMVSDSFW